jgi:hypothetical protein
MKKYICFYLALFVFTYTQGMNDSIPLVKVSGYASFKYSIADSSSFQLNWAVVQLDKKLKGNLLVHAGYDFSTEKPDDVYLGYKKDKWTLVAGQILAPVPYLFPGPSTIRLPRWATLLNAYSLREKGVAVWYENEERQLTGRAAVYQKGGDMMFVGAGTWHGLSVFYEQNAGYGFLYETPWKSEWCNIIIGSSFTNIKSEVNGVTSEQKRSTYFVQNHWKILSDVDLHGQIDFGDMTPRWLIGLSWEVSKGNFLQMFVDMQKGEPTWQTEFKLSF